jgi:geranylgeranyl reductase family protein
METVSDAIIVGGGPCGSFVALNLAKHGFNVTVFEEHEEIGIPCHCTGHLSINGLRALELYPLPQKIVENFFYGANFHSPSGKTLSVRFSQPITCIVNRALFDKHIAENAKKAGVQYSLNSQVKSLIIENDFVKGALVKLNGEIDDDFTAKIVVDAEGISSRILRQTGLQTLNNEMLVNAVQAEVENVKDIESDMVEVFLGKDYAPGFYAWLAPKQDGKAKVGLAAQTGNPKEFLQKLMYNHPAASRKLRTARILRTIFHPVTLGGPIPRAYSNGFLAVGDVASQVKPTTGGGVIMGMNCARIAAEVAGEALRANNFSSNFLSKYQRQCEKILGFDMKAMLKIRKMLNAMSDKKIDYAISFCTKLGLDKTLQNVEDIDFQGKTLVHALRSPRVLSVLFYLFLLHLSANP